MKKTTTIILLTSLFSSCVNHLDEAELIYQQGISEMSKDILKDAILEANMIRDHQKNYDEAQKLVMKIDSVLLSWKQDEERRLKEQRKD